MSKESSKVRGTILNPGKDEEANSNLNQVSHYVLRSVLRLGTIVAKTNENGTFFVWPLRKFALLFWLNGYKIHKYLTKKHISWNTFHKI